MYVHENYVCTRCVQVIYKFLYTNDCFDKPQLASSIPNAQASSKSGRSLREFERADPNVESNWGGTATGSDTTIPQDPPPPKASSATASKRRKVTEGASGEIFCVKCNRSSKARVHKQCVFSFQFSPTP